MKIDFSAAQTDFFLQQMTPAEQQAQLAPARVIAVDKQTYHLCGPGGQSVGKLKGSAFYQRPGQALYPAVGDYVLTRPNDQGDDVIYRVLPRKSAFIRANPGQH
ncbi:MAG: hypothetical protein PHO66_06630, partial [Eubacteriales bacterium]|nr:hypothetical protein [Eubacteriales bacterium]